MSAVASHPTSAAYQTMLVGLLGVNIGVVFLDRTAFGLLAPLIQPEFSLTNAQVGMVGGALSVTWALSSFFLTRTADLTGRAKALLVAATVVFSLASISSGLAIGFLTLLAARALMGLAEGGLPPLTFDIVTREVAPERRGLAVGLTSMIGLQAVPLLGPAVIVSIGAIYGWREAFWVAGVPGLIMAAAIWLLARNPPRVPAESAAKGSVGSLLAIRNIRFAVLLAMLNMTFYASLLGFGPLYLVNVAGMSTAMMGLALTGIGVIGVIFAFACPILSDRIGRKPVIFAAYAISIVGAVMLALAGSSVPLAMAGALLAGAGGAGVGALVMAVIPGEAAPEYLRGTAMGLNAGLGELIGAGLMPVLIGVAADRYGLGVLPWILAVVGALFCFVSLALRESAPRLVALQAEG